MEARLSSEALAKRLNLSAATVRRRLRTLIENDILRFMGVVDPTKFGCPLAVMIAISIVPGKLELALEKLAEMPEINWAATTTGRFDIIARAQFGTTQDISDFMKTDLAQLEGLQDSETFLCLEMRRGFYIPLRY
jgi:Lrp/AsnC family transcriptional regulator for asnA, asnC and gidA